MKKFAVQFLCLAILLTLVVTGCAPQKTNLIMSTGGTSGTYYPFGGAMAQIFNTKIPGMNVTAQSTGASKENLRLIGKGESDIAIVQNDVLDYAAKGIELFNGEKIESALTMATLYPEVVQIVVNPKSGINSIADMKGKRISVGDPGSGVEANAKQILEVNGLKFSDLKESHLSFNESANGYKNNQLDGFFVTAGIPNTAIQEISALQEVRILTVDKATIEKLQKAYPYYTTYTIKANTYKGVTADTVTVAVKAMLVVRKGLKDDVVYNLTKALFENKAELAKAHAKGNELDINEAVKGVSVPFHPGAQKYYKEKGVLK